jgi:hypothetical protein
MENSHGLMVQHTRDSLWTIIFKEKVFTIGQISEVMREIGKITKCKERVSSNGLTAENMKESISMIRRKDTESSLGLMKESMMDSGRMESNMV